MVQLKDTALLKRLAFIGGEWVAARDGASHEVRNPANGETIAAVPDMDAADTERAIAAAQAALPAWRARPAKERSALLRRWHDLVLVAEQDLALLMTLEQGKSLAEALGEVRYGASFIEWFAEEGKRAYGDLIRHRPLTVV